MITRNTLLISIILVQAAEKLAFNNLCNGKITWKTYEEKRIQFIQQLDNIGNLATKHNIP